MIHAVLPAAGKSSRMGRSKLVLPVGESTVIGCLIGVLQRCGVESILVIVAPGESQIDQLALDAGASVIRLSEETPGMRETTSFALDWLLKTESASVRDFCLLIPADHPALTTSSLTKLLEAAKIDLSHEIFVPAYEGKRGHPVLLPLSLAEEIASLPPTSGINELIRKKEAQTRIVEVDDPAILWDLDTAEDYQKLLAHVKQQQPDHETGEGFKQDYETYENH